MARSARNPGCASAAFRPWSALALARSISACGKLGLRATSASSASMSADLEESALALTTRPSLLA
ncbi:MAG: hypothetical protein ABS41_06455 [Arenimonas sp. SCN 70-307]|nr:MAG: hypothetical protein ABS41_06455 [Arenimonas sp. SCN 70-307]